MDEESGLRVTRSRRRMSVDQDTKPTETTPAPATPTTAKANRRMSMEREVKIPEDNASATPTKRKLGRMSIKPELPNVIENVVLDTPSKKSPDLPARGRMSILPIEVKVILEDVVQDSPSKRTRSKKATGATDDEGSDARTPSKRVTRNLLAAVNSPMTRRISRRISVAGNENEVENPVVTPLKRNRTVSHSVISPSTQIGKDNVSPIGQSFKTPAKDNSTTNKTPNSNLTLVMRDDSVSPIRKSPRQKNSPKEMSGACPSNTTSPENTHILVEASPAKAQRKSLSTSLGAKSKIGKCESPIDVFAPKGDIGQQEPPQPMDVDDSFQFNDTSFGSSGLLNDSVSAPEKSHQCHGKEISINIKNDDNTSFKVSFTSSSTSIDILGTGNTSKKSDTDTTADSAMKKNKTLRNSSLNESGNKSKTPTKNASSVKDSNAVIDLDTTTESIIKKNKRNSVNESKNESKTTIDISKQLEKSDTDLNSTTDSITTKTQKKRNSLIDESKTIEESGNRSIKNAQNVENSTDAAVDKNAEMATPKTKRNFQHNESSNKTITPTVLAQEVEKFDTSGADFNVPTKNKRKSLNISANRSIKHAQEIENSTDTDVDRIADSATPKTNRTFQSNESINKTTPTRIVQEVGKSDTSDADFDTPSGNSISTKNKRKSSNNTKTPIKNTQDNEQSDVELLKMERNSVTGHKAKTPVKNPSDADIESPTGDSISTNNKRKSLNKSANQSIKNASDIEKSTDTDVDKNAESATPKTKRTFQSNESFIKTLTPTKIAQEMGKSDTSDVDIKSPTGDSLSTKNKRKSLNNANTPIKNAQDSGPSNVEPLKLKRNSESGHKTRTPVKNAGDADIETPTGDSILTKSKRNSLNKTPIKNIHDNGQSDPESFKMKRNFESGHKTPVKNAQIESSNNRNSSLDESIAKKKKKKKTASL